MLDLDLNKTSMQQKPLPPLTSLQKMNKLRSKTQISRTMEGRGAMVSLEVMEADDGENPNHHIPQNWAQGP